MAYRFKHREGVEKGLRRIARQQLERASAELGDPSLAPDAAVHQVRKRLKKLRGLLRLVWPVIGEAAYRPRNRRFRDLGRALADVRDADIMLQTLDDLAGRLQGEDAGSDLSGLRRHLSDQRAQARGNGTQDLHARRETVAAELQAICDQLDDWSLPARGFAALGPGLQQTYARGRKAMRKAYASPSDARFHEWRKRAKDHWYHSRLLTGVWPGLLKPYTKEMQRLSDLLGDDHDLATFRQRLGEMPADVLPAETSAALQRLIAARQKTLRDEARQLGYRIYGGRPKRVGRRIGRWWKTWRHGPP
jgi:CHAD domain-containing protein